MIGTTVSHYRILERVGQGGMGIVYKAEDTTLKRAVALKFLPRGLETHDVERARFLQEAQAASALNHPNVCTIHEISEHEGQQFIVMEFVDGTTLRSRISEGGLRIRDAIDFAAQIAEALEEAHSKGIVHRDVKAENIMVNAKNQIKVMDFGLAKLKGSLKLNCLTAWSIAVDHALPVMTTRRWSSSGAGSTRGLGFLRMCLSRLSKSERFRLPFRSNHT